MAWGTVELEPEVEEWVLSLDDDRFGQVERYIDLLADQGVYLREPFTRQLRGKLRELRFYLGRQQTRITYYVASGRRVVLLTVLQRRVSVSGLRSSAHGRRCNAASAKDIQRKVTHDA